MAGIPGFGVWIGLPRNEAPIRTPSQIFGSRCRSNVWGQDYLRSQMGASVVGLPRGRLCLIWCGRRPKAACGRGCSPVEAYIALASPRSRAARRDSGRARLPRLPEAKFIRFYYVQRPRERRDERALAGAAAGPQLSDQGLCGAPVSFWQAIAWCGRVSRARSARPFTATDPPTRHEHGRRFTSLPQPPKSLGK